MKNTLKQKVTKWFCALSFIFYAQLGFAGSPSWVTIDSINYAGSGCPAGSVAENVASDLKAFTLLFDEYIAEIGPGVPYREKRKNCQISLALDFPQGWSFTLVKVDYRGYASLDKKVKGTQQASYYFQGQRKTGKLRSNYYGEFDDDYQVSDTLGVSALVWSPCGAQRALNINTQVRLDNRRNRRGSGIMTVDSVDGTLTHIYGIKWKRCR